MKQVLSIVITGLALSISAGAASAQHHPYAGMQTRSITDQQLADLKAGRRDGAYPRRRTERILRPARVLELSQELSLTTGQREQVERLFSAMKAETIALDGRLSNRKR